ncbi:hypothetical protein U0070_026655 [Myodes glareolus]|uniref:Uncharacterized protein n=1 Tax=Myodes glareolus TaxID=447135 RepID=A0AAW0JKG9_MYOGA
MLQALVEFQFKAVNTQPTVTIIDATHVVWGLHVIISRITRIVRVGKRTRDRKALLKAKPNNWSYRRRRFPPYYLRRPYGCRPQYSNPPVQGEVMEGADNQGAGEQGRPVRQNVYWGYRPRFRRDPPRQRQPREHGKEEDKENQGDETRGQQPPQRRYRRNFNYRCRCPENPKPRDGKEIHQLRIRLLPRLSRAGLSKCQLTISTIIRFGHPTRRNKYEIPAIRNEQRLEPKTLSACFLPVDQIR